MTATRRRRTLPPDTVIGRAIGWAVLALSVTLVVLFMTGCTRAQVTAWVAWHETDPAAAEEFANLPEVQAALHARTPQRTRPAAAPSARWDRIAWCESGGRWDHPPVTNSTGTYSGGLMIWVRAWTVYGGTEFAPQAWQASKAEQIVVAERILADRGWGAWDCA
jgi:hypothetical protein